MSVVLVKEPLSGTMHGRGGFSFKAVIYAAFVLSLIYMFYIYNNAQSNLREAEMTGSRYKREAEERVTEIQELVRAKDRLQESCQNEKAELHTRIKSLNQQYSMVHSQYKETEADFIKLRQDMDTLKAEHSQADSAHASEYEKLKQDKENDIAKLKDDVADLTRQNQNLQNSIASLRQKVKEDEVELQSHSSKYQNLEENFFALQNAYKHLLDQSVKLQQQLQNKPQDLQQLPVAGQQPLEKQSNLEVLGATSPGRLDQIHAQGDDSFQKQSLVTSKPDVLLQDDNKPSLDESLNAAHQVRPPNNNVNINNDDVDGRHGFKDVVFRPQVNPNDEQKGQILEPMLDSVDKHQGGGEDGVVNMNARREEEKRENNVRDEEAETLHRKNPLPLPLGQIEIPGELKDLDDSVLQKKKTAELMPPLLNDENDQKEQEHGENHYFGEDEEAQQQQQQQEEDQQQKEDDRRQQEEEERDEGDLEHADRLHNDLGNQDNKEAALRDENNE